MIFRTAPLFVGFSLLLGGCAYNADPGIRPANNVVTSFSQKVAGKWLLRTDASRLIETVRPEDFNCAAHTYPLDFSGSFGPSVRATLRNVVSDLDDAPEGMAADRAKTLAARGIISVQGESVQSRMRVVPGWWSASFVTEVTISAAVTADGGGGRIFGKTVDGRGRTERPVGAFCAGGADALKASAELALADLLRRVGEEIGNSERIRAAR